MLLNIFRAVSLPFFIAFDFLYCRIFQVKPVGESPFAVEKRPHKYSGPPLDFPNGIKIRRGDKVLGLHLIKDKLGEIFSGGSMPKEKIREMLVASLKELAGFSSQSRHAFVAFCGKTPLRLFKARDYGFSVMPIGGKISDIEASLQFFYLGKSRRGFPKRRFFQYLIPREILEERFGEKI